MSKGRIYCDWCGEDMGEGSRYLGQLETCGKPECNREVHAMEREREEQARYDAERDGYDRYR